MELSKTVIALYEAILEMGLNKAIKIYNRALDGDKLTHHQMEAAKDLLNKLPPIQPKIDSNLTIHFGDLPRPGEDRKEIVSNSSNPPQLEEPKKEANPVSGIGLDRAP